MRAVAGLAASVAIIAAAYGADHVVAQAIRTGQASFRSGEAMLLDLVLRIGVAALLVGLAWLVFRGPRTRAVGLVMALAGLYFAIWPGLWWAFPEIPLLPLQLEAVSSRFMGWSAAIVGLLGIVELVWPTPVPSPGVPLPAPAPSEPAPTSASGPPERPWEGATAVPRDVDAVPRDVDAAPGDVTAAAGDEVE